MCPSIPNAATIVVVPAVSACTSDSPPAEGNWTRVPQAYRMGSRIPVRERSPALTAEERQRQADQAADDLLRMQRVSGTPPQGGH
jgi:hypothetical protein